MSNNKAKVSRCNDIQTPTKDRKSRSKQMVVPNSRDFSGKFSPAPRCSNGAAPSSDPVPACSRALAAQEGHSQHHSGDPGPRQEGGQVKWVKQGPNWVKADVGRDLEIGVPSSQSLTSEASAKAPVTQPSSSTGSFSSQFRMSPAQPSSSRNTEASEGAAKERRERRLAEKRECQERRFTEEEQMRLVMQMSLMESQSSVNQEDEDEAFKKILRQSLVESVRSQLPKTYWTSKQANQDEPQECACCLEEYAEGDEVTRMHCMHVFHSKCLDPWLDKQSTCPVCQTDLLDTCS